MSSACLERSANALHPSFAPAQAKPPASHLAEHRPALNQHLEAGGPQYEAWQLDPDNDLVARVQGGDSEAFGELIALHRVRVYRTLVSIVGRPEAEDAMQDTFLKAFQHIETFQHRSKFSTWLATIAANTGVERLRRRKHVECLDDLMEGVNCRPSFARAPDADPEQLCAQAERRKIIEQGIKKVPYRYRAVLMLRDIQHLSAEETAAVLGIRVPALKARLFRGRTMLRRILEPSLAVSPSAAVR